MDQPPKEQNRYHRQTLLAGIGQTGQRRLAQASVLLVGCGALGTPIADSLVRAGVGFLRIADRDVVELTNLQRQVLFDEEDARQAIPKAVAAGRRLKQINSSVQIDSQVVDVHSGNLEELANIGRSAVNLILDGTDNIETRYLINDVSIKHGIPWIYGACVGTEGRAMPIIPGKTPCLRCIFPQPPAPGELATCDTAGVLGPAAQVVAAIQSATAIKLLAGHGIEPHLIALDLWTGHFHRFTMDTGRHEDCPCCVRKGFEFLNRNAADRAVSLCGRNAVQVAAPRDRGFDMNSVSRRLESAGQMQRNAYFLRCELRDATGISLTVFPDGRVMVHGTGDISQARSIVSRYVGS